MSINQNPSKPRQSRLRASCDGCFHAKVKCSKSRPICSRCLACGADCKYSPSSRAGKPKADGSRANHSNHSPSASRDVSIPDNSNSTVTYPSQVIGIDAKQSATFSLDPDWSAPPCLKDEQMHRQSLSSTIGPMMGDESSSEAGSSGANQELFDPSFPWPSTPRTDITTPFTENILLSRSKSMVDVPVPPSLAPWFEGQIDHVAFNHTPGLGPLPSNVYMSNTPMPRSQTCYCFSTCLQALQALHNYSSPATSVPPFDVVLTVNRKAVEGCAMMLNCSKCLSKSGSNTTTMVLATIIGKILSFYRAASESYFGLTPGPRSQSQPLPLTFGTYRVAGEDGRWLEMEILLRELRKMEELFAKFQEAARKSELEEDGGVHTAVTNYLGQSLHFTFEILNMQKEITFG